MSNSEHKYTFFTTEKDRFLRRIAEEAPADVDFILVRRTNRREKKNQQFLLISKKLLNDGRLGFVSVDGFPLGPHWGTELTEKFRVTSYIGGTRETTAILREQIEKAKEALAKPTIHVTVEYL